MPHSVKEQAEAPDVHRGDKPSRLSPSSTGNATQEQSPMLRAWSDEFDPRSLTISEILFASGFARDDGPQSRGGLQSVNAVKL
ncbi:hypothetical protein VTH82DRAFT_4525 [Thermothelomyces myriococcoides]